MERTSSDSQPGTDEPSADYSYDLAHEATSGTARHPGHTHVSVARPGKTAQGDADSGDYGYDMAHDLPE